MQTPVQARATSRVLPLLLLTALAVACGPAERPDDAQPAAAEAGGSLQCGVLAPQGTALPSLEGYVYTEDWFSWNIPPWEAALERFRGQPDVQYLEIGVFEGRSLLWALENVLTDPTSRATVIDPLTMPSRPNLEEIFRGNVARAGETERVRVIKGFSQIELRRLPLDTYDIIYIDGSHASRDVLEDAVLSWRLLKDGGVLIFDDYEWTEGSTPMDRPMAAVNTFVEYFGDEMTLLHCGYQLMIEKKRESQGPDA